MHSDLGEPTTSAKDRGTDEWGLVADRPKWRNPSTGHAVTDPWQRRNWRRPVAHLNCGAQPLCTLLSRRARGGMDIRQWLARRYHVANPDAEHDPHRGIDHVFSACSATAQRDDRVPDGSRKECVHGARTLRDERCHDRRMREARWLIDRAHVTTLRLNNRPEFLPRRAAAYRVLELVPRFAS
jgi:hypothetical protein